MKRFSIRLKALLAVGLSLVFIFSLIISALVVQNTSRLRSDLNEKSKSFASLAAKPIGETFVLYKDSGHLRISQEMDDFLALDADVSSIRIVGVDGQVLFSSSRQNQSPVAPAAAAAFEPQYLSDSQGYISQIVQPYFEDSGAHRYSVVYSISTKRLQNSVQEVVRLIILVGVAVLIISIASTVLLLNSIFIKPIRSVSRSAGLISSGDYDQQISTARHDEIGDLAKSVNSMAEALKADIEKLRELDKLKTEFMMITAHNLRTPLTIMEGYVEMAEAAKTPKQYRDIFEVLSANLTRLHLLAEDVLTVSTFESGKVSLQLSPVIIRDFIDQQIGKFTALAHSKKFKWQFNNELSATQELNISKVHLGSAIANIIDNAIKFTPEGGQVTITARQQAGQIELVVTDNGIGISESELSKLFTKFHRGTDIQKTYDYEGLGLGLYLSKLIIEQHHGTIGVNSRQDHGSTFTINLPLQV